jgi:subtilase family serine protease
LQNVLLDGSIGDEVANGDAEAEVCLDIEMPMAIATNLAAVVVFEAPYNTASTATWNDILNTMAASNQIKQCSSSWGYSGTPSQTSDQIFQQMAAQGQSFFQASGDGDAWTSPIWEPAESTNVIVVGGTTLSMNGAGGSYLSETVWNLGNVGVSWGLNGSTNDYEGSGGGVSANYAIPYWQAGVNMTTNLGSTTMRNIPDVAMTANDIYVTHGSGANGSYGGTSCAAPLWAGFMALVNQQAAGMDNPPAGFINPAVYALGGSTNYPACFHDITTGSNTWSGSPNLYYAVPGYDLCTGWGTPAGTNLINALAGGAPDTMVITPLAGFVANGAPGGPFNGAVQVFTLNNAGVAPLNWSLINTSAWLTASSSSGTLGAGNQTTVAVSLAPAANTLAAGSYNAVVCFSNLTTHIAQPQAFTLRVGQTLVQDGGFESGSFCHWTLAGRTTIDSGAIIENGVESAHTHYNPVHSGNYGAMFADSTLAVIYQTLPTYPGQKYLLSFWLFNPTGGAGEQFEVNWNTNSPTTNTIYSLSNPPALAWTNVSFVVTATGLNTTLQFGAYNQPNYFGLDDVSVTPVPPPSFSSVATATNGMAFTWATLANVGYIVQYKTNLLQPNWLNLGGSITAGTNTLTLLDTNAFSSSPERFYRVSVSP